MKTKVAATERKARARKIIARLKREYPDATCALHHSSALELVVATILSAQCTDARVNMVTPQLFAKYRTAADYAAAGRGPEDGKRHPGDLVQEERGRGRGHARPSADPLAQAHPPGRSRENRAGPDGDRAARGLDVVLPYADSARARGVHRTPAEVRGLRDQSPVPELAGMTSLAPVDRTSLVATRRDIHQHPELGFEETRTATLIADRLRTFGYEVTSGVGKTGVVALKRNEGRCVLLRADMDALPVEEATAVPYRSKHPGKMHACGHDGHVAIGLEVARRLAPLGLA